jgi:hypothetical protein
MKEEMHSAQQLNHRSMVNTINAVIYFSTILGFFERFLLISAAVMAIS